LALAAQRSSFLGQATRRSAPTCRPRKSPVEESSIAS
jgi:hypothetical protein